MEEVFVLIVLQDHFQPERLQNVDFVRQELTKVDLANQVVSVAIQDFIPCLVQPSVYLVHQVHIPQKVLPIVHTVH
jgi:hypothetical protein